MESKLIWQIENLASTHGPCFTVNLDKEFAKEMINLKVSQEVQKRINSKSLEKFKINNSNPMKFYKDTAFIDNFYLGENGVWLNADPYSFKKLMKGNLEENIEYSTHNVDTVSDTYRLIGLFDLWIYYSTVLKDLNK